MIEIDKELLKRTIELIQEAYSISSLRHWKKQYEGKSEDQIPPTPKTYIKVLEVYDELMKVYNSGEK